MSIDTSRIDIEFDPLTQRMTGYTAHGYHFFDVPFMSQVADNLWVGGCKDGLVLPRNISHLLSLYPWEAYTTSRRLRTWHEVTMYDSLGQAMVQVDRWARWVNARRRTGEVLVHCQAGLNRSNLIAARALMMEGMSADDAIVLLREKRSPASLCNPSFVDYLQSL